MKILNDFFLLKSICIFVKDITINYHSLEIGYENFLFECVNQEIFSKNIRDGKRISGVEDMIEETDSPVKKRLNPTNSSHNIRKSQKAWKDQT